MNALCLDAEENVLTGLTRQATSASSILSSKQHKQSKNRNGVKRSSEYKLDSIAACLIVSEYSGQYEPWNKYLRVCMYCPGTI